jgi:hypothetical protein
MVALWDLAFGLKTGCIRIIAGKPKVGNEFRVFLITEFLFFTQFDRPYTNSMPLHIALKASQWFWRRIP